MIAFRILLIILLAILFGYTGIVIVNHGFGQAANIFFGGIALLNWGGQFNLDFLFMLILCALWIAWRHQFSVTGIILSLLALTGGCLFLTTYLSILSWQTNGDMKQLLLGKARVEEYSSKA